MTRQEAETEAARRNREQAPGSMQRWFVRADGGGGWSPVKLGAAAGALKATVEAKPKPPQADDPRPSYWRDVGGPWVG